MGAVEMDQDVIPLAFFEDGTSLAHISYEVPLPKSLQQAELFIWTTSQDEVAVRWSIPDQQCVIVEVIVRSESVTGELGYLAEILGGLGLTLSEPVELEEREVTERHGRISYRRRKDYLIVICR